MDLTTESRIGKRHTIYLPREVVEEAELQEGMKILITVEGNQIIIEPLPDPVTLAVEGEKFASMTLEEMEAISHEEQSEYTKNSA
ncbi:MAG: AbrB/MazE/SpoVT family DNA-binding domain-containing protein [Candidatus Thorarchaeota archaeon]